MVSWRPRHRRASHGRCSGKGLRARRLRENDATVVALAAARRRRSRPRWPSFPTPRTEAPSGRLCATCAPSAAHTARVSASGSPAADARSGLGRRKPWPWLVLTGLIRAILAESAMRSQRSLASAAFSAWMSSSRSPRSNPCSRKSQNRAVHSSKGHPARPIPRAPAETYPPGSSDGSRRACRRAAKAKSRSHRRPPFARYSGPSSLLAYSDMPRPSCQRILISAPSALDTKISPHADRAARLPEPAMRCRSCRAAYRFARPQATSTPEGTRIIAAPVPRTHAAGPPVETTSDTDSVLPRPRSRWSLPSTTVDPRPGAIRSALGVTGIRRGPPGRSAPGASG